MDQPIYINWSNVRAMGSAEHIPAALHGLAAARNPQEATKEYWRIDNTVVVQGQLFEAAVPVSEYLVQLLPNASVSGRPRMLELLAQISNGEADQSEIDRGNDRIRENCIDRIIRSMEQFEHIISVGDTAEKLHCIDTLTACADQRPEYVNRVLEDLEAVLKREQTGEVATLAQRWLTHLTMP